MISKKDISFIQPSRNNLKYLKWSYDSIRKNGGPDPHICVADDFSSDGTWEWCQSTMKIDPNFLAIRNEGPDRLGHTILYDRLINEVAPTKIVGIFHADMYLCPGSLESVIENIKPKTIVSLTRIEPPLHPDGPEKILLDCGTEPETFDEEKLLNSLKIPATGKITNGIFAPWFLYKDDFQEIGGHDVLYAPQSKEDSDIFNRFQLNGCEFVQTWDGCVYHMTCRGSRFNPTITEVGIASDEWQKQNIKSTRNFIRKWGHFVKHDTMMKPIIPPKYDIAFIVDNCSSELISLLEPWCSAIYLKDNNVKLVGDYITLEQPNTKFNLKTRVSQLGINDPHTEHDIVVEFDCMGVSNYMFELITQFSEILNRSDLESGEFILEIFKFTVNSVKTYETDLININSNIYR